MRLTFLILLCGFALQAWAQPVLEILAWEADAAPATVPLCSPGSATVINFNDVPVMIEKEYKFKLRAKPGTGSVSVTSSSWTTGTGFPTTFSIPPVSLNTGGVEYTMKFAPGDAASLGAATAELIIRTEANPADDPNDCYEDADPATTDKLEVRIQFRGNVTKPVINYSLVLDKSGSMGESYGTGTISGQPERKMDKLRIAVLYFTDLMRIANTTQGFTGDNLSIVTYDNTSPTPAFLGKQIITQAIKNDLRSTRLADVATRSGGSMFPNGSTNMAAGVLNGMGQYTTTDKKVMIVFTDGIENVHPYTSENPPRATIIGAAGNLDIYTVAMGDEVNETSLRDLSTNSGFSVPRYYYVREAFINDTSPAIEFAGTAYSLNAIYKKIYADAMGFEEASDPEKRVCLCTGSQQLFNTWITTSDKQAIFSVFHEGGGQKELYTLDLLDAKGNIVSAASPTGGMTIEETRQPEYTIYKVDFSGADPAFYSGEWKLMLNVKSASKQIVPFGFGAITASNLKMASQAVAERFVPGSPIRLNIDIAELGKQVTVKDIIVSVLTPSGKIYKVVPDKNAFGSYTLNFPETYETGNYTLYTQAAVYNSKRELSSRESTVYVGLSNETMPTEYKEPCMSCSYQKWGIRLIFIFVVLIFIIIIFRWVRSL